MGRCEPTDDSSCSIPMTGHRRWARGNRCCSRSTSSRSRAETSWRKRTPSRCLRCAMESDHTRRRSAMVDFSRSAHPADRDRGRLTTFVAHPVDMAVARRLPFGPQLPGDRRRRRPRAPRRARSAEGAAHRLRDASRPVWPAGVARAEGAAVAGPLRHRAHARGRAPHWHLPCRLVPGLARLVRRRSRAAVGRAHPPRTAAISPARSCSPMAKKASGSPTLGSSGASSHTRQSMSQSK